MGQQRRIFNYRLSRARLTVENAFGILASRFRTYQGRVCLHPDNVERIVKASVILHNMLQRTGAIRPQELQLLHVAMGPVNHIGHTGSRDRVETLHVREKFNVYLNSDAGSVEWQLKKIRSTNVFSLCVFNYCYTIINKSAKNNNLVYFLYIKRQQFNIQMKQTCITNISIITLVGKWMFPGRHF